MNKGDPMKEWFHEWMAEKPPNGRAALFWELQSSLIACTSFSKFMTELTESRLWQKTKFSTNWPQLLDYRQAVGGRRTTGFVSNGQLVSQKEVNFRWFLRINSHRFFLSNKCKLWSFSEQIRQSSVEQIWVWKVKVFLHTPTCFGMRRLSVLIWGFSAFFFFCFMSPWIWYLVILYFWLSTLTPSVVFINWTAVNEAVVSITLLLHLI